MDKLRTFSEFISEGFEVSNKPDGTGENDKPEIFYPEGVYISVKLSEETEALVKEYQEKYLKGQDIVDINSLHCTLIYSKQPEVNEIEPAEYTAVGTFQEFNLFGEKSDTLVAEINSFDLLRRNEILTQEYKFISDFDEYKSHVTLAYGVENIDINSLPPMDFGFVFENETVEQLDLDWAGSGDDSDNESGTIVGKALTKMKKDAEKPKKKDDEDTEDTEDTENDETED